MSFQNTGGVGGTGPNANMAASLDDDFESNNQDYYSLLNVRKEVRLFFCAAAKPDDDALFAMIVGSTSFEKVTYSRCIIVELNNGLPHYQHHHLWRLRPAGAAEALTSRPFKHVLYTMQGIHFTMHVNTGNMSASLSTTRGHNERLIRRPD